MARHDQELLRQLKVEWLDFVLVALAFLAVLNIVAALVSGRAEVFSVVPCWIVLMAVCVTQRHMADKKIITILLGTALCYGVQTLMYLGQAQAAELRTTEMAVSIGLVYVPLLGFFVILVATKTDNLQSARDHLYAKFVRLRTDANDMLNRLQKVRQGGGEEDEKEDDTAVSEKRAAFEFYRNTFLATLGIRYKRDVATAIEAVLKEELLVQHGIIYEIPDEKGTETKVRTSWGLADKDAVRDAVQSYRDSDLTRLVVDTHRSLFLDEIKRFPNLYEAHDNFIKQLFPIECIMPVCHGDKTLFVAVIGKQKEGASVKFAPQVVEPLFSTAGQAIGKLMSRDARPSFQLFVPGS